MVQANEVRVGNRFIRELHNHNRGLDYDKDFVLDEDNMGMLFVDIRLCLNDLFPIPLTPEILEKCGFVKNRNGEPSIEINDIASHLELMVGVDNFHYPSFTQTPQGDEERTVFFNRINSLHQLQNLYFALCGTELPINPLTQPQK